MPAWPSQGLVTLCDQSSSVYACKFNTIIAYKLQVSGLV